MTKINSVAIHGFKSFAHKTHIPFENKYNCILGPNGSGKSNIGDALCFVLGRLSAKSMRAEKAANLIFNGGKNKKPADKGTVEISFCNKNKVFPVDENEVNLSRTITKTGSSIYRVNGKKSTRTQVLDLLSVARINPEGYNIVLQGDISRFVTMSPLERRKVIEEISDVSIYEEKKHKAMLELNKVEDKLQSATIILKERGTYLKELKKDRDQAFKFKELKLKIDSLKATVLHHKIQDKQQENQKFLTEVEKQQVKIDKANQQIDKLKEKVGKQKQEIKNINQQIEQKGEKEQVKVHREIEDLKVEMAKNKTRISALKDEINKVKLRKEQFETETKELSEKSAKFDSEQQQRKKQILIKEKELQELQRNIENFKKKNKIENSQAIEEEIEQKDKLIEQKQEEVLKIRTAQQDLLRKKDRLEYQLQTIDEKIAKVKSIEQESKEQLNQLTAHKTNFKQAALNLNKCLDNDASFASQLANAKRKLVDLQETGAKLSAKTNSIKASAAANLAVKSIIENKNKFKGVHGTIAQLGKVNRKYSQALETCAGSRLQHIVVENDEVAASCIKYLKDNKLGSASFIPLNKIKSNSVTSENKTLLRNNGVHDFAINLISFERSYAKAFTYVFSNSLIVEDLTIARKVGVGNIRMITLDGAIAEASGVMRGGFIQKRMGSGFQEKDSLEELKKIENETAQMEGVIHNITSKREANEQEISSLRTLKAELEAKIITLEKTLHLGSGDLDASTRMKKEIATQIKEADSEIAKIHKQLTQLNGDLAKLKSDKQNLRLQITELRNPRIAAQLSAYEDSRQQCREEILSLKSDLKNSELNITQLLGPEQQKIQEIIKQHDKEEKEFTQEIEKLSGKVKLQESELQLKEKASKDFYSKYHQLFNNREKFSSQTNQMENEIENLREKARESERLVNAGSLKNAEIKAILAGLEEEFKHYEDAKLLKGQNLPELQKEINKFEVMIGQMSAVNMKALEIYEEIEAEFNKLIEKKNNLNGEKTDVLTMMNEIETKKKEHFMKTFQHTNDNFKNIFTNLFKKGKAHLQLDNPNKPFEDGLSIKVKISGKRFMDLKSLSGGEKTLTALSFIFAVQDYQPATFYILDEIDAALDKHNSEKLAKLIRNYADNAQYIVISHNDSIISEADTLFGVSMNDDVSKVTSLKI